MIKESKTSASTIEGDLPMKLIKEFGPFLVDPLMDIWKRCFDSGEYPDRWKVEVVTPIPKILPPKEPSNFRKISGTLNFSKLTEKFFCSITLKCYLDNYHHITFL